MRNRSVPTDTVLPHVTYRDVAAAIEWLARAFGLSEHYRYGPPDRPQGAQVRLGGAWFMLESARPGSVVPADAGHRTQYLSVFVPDVDAHHARARAAGAKVVEELNETAYGERQYVAEDLDGHPWLFSQHVRDVAPDDWGATLAGR